MTLRKVVNYLYIFSTKELSLNATVYNRCADAPVRDTKTVEVRKMLEVWDKARQAGILNDLYCSVRVSNSMC